jgi:citrate synthase
MTQLSIAMLALQKDSKFSAAYDSGMKKAEYWEYALEDALDLIAKIPVVAAYIYRRTFKDGPGPAYDSKLDWAANYANMLGVNSSEDFREVTRLYLMLHADHEGGNVSAHTTHLVGSALSDPYYSWAAGLCGLAGPLHGLANQECLSWLLQVQKDLKGQTPTKDLLTQYAEDTLAAGKVIPGFGHAVLRNTDPRYMLEREFALKHCQSDPLFQLVDACYQAIPELLQKKGKVKNPFPNVDAHSGQLMYFYNLKEQNYYTVVFAVSRAIGVMSQIVWARAIGLPIERPKSVPLDVLKNLATK